MKNNYVINLRYFLLISCIYLFAFQNLLQTYIPIFQYFDEFVALIFLPFVISRMIRKKNKKIDNLIITLLLIIFLLGIIGNVIFKYQSLKYIIFDVVLFFKFYLIYFGTGTVWNNEFIEKNREKIKFHITFITLILCFFTILNYIFVFWPNEFRYGILSNKLFYSHPTFLSGICIFLLSFSIRLNKNIISLKNIAIMIILVSTLRFKAIGEALAILFISIYVEKTNKKLSISKIVFLGLILLVFAFNQINFYFFKNDGFARKELLNTSVIIAKDNFPIGTGFGTFGSYYSGENYSPVYYKYSLNKVYGLSPQYHYYISDSFYPMILGQFGFFGLILYCGCIILIFKKIQLIDIKKNKYEYISKICALSYLIISSSSESSFTGPMAISLALILGFEDKLNKEE